MIIYWPLSWLLWWQFAKVIAYLLLFLEILLLLFPNDQYAFFWPFAVPGALLVARWLRRR